MGDYYYLETKPQPNTLKVVHKSGCLKLTLLRHDKELLGTFYTSADALAKATKRYRACKACPMCCRKSA